MMKRRIVALLLAALCACAVLPAMADEKTADSRVKNRLSNGPLRAQSNVGNYRVFCDGRHTLVAGDMMVSQKGHEQS